MSYVPEFLARLSLGNDADERAIRRAYARILKQIDPEKDPATFQALREDYETALGWARIPIENSHTSFEFERQPGIELTVLPSPISKPDFSLPMVSVKFKTEPASDQQSQADIANLIENESYTEQHSAAQDDPATLSAEVFAEFQAHCASLVQQQRFAEDRWWSEAIQNALKDPRLDSIIARELFELHIANLLARGWQPGHETLFVAAGKVFNWVKDKRRLFTFGASGSFLNRAIDERSMFDQQHGGKFNEMKKIIARLRDNSPPSTRELIKKMPYLEHLFIRYPVWLQVITNTNNFHTWQTLDAEVPSWRRKLAYKATPVKPKEKMTFTWNKAVMFFVIIGVLRGLSHIGDEPKPPPSNSSLPLSAMMQNDVQRSISQLDEAARSPSAFPTIGSSNLMTQINNTLKPISIEPDVSLRVIKRVMPNYPKAAIQDNIQGMVLLKVLIDDKGRVEEVRVVKSPNEILSNEAVKAMKLWTFEAPTIQGKISKVWVMQPMNFSI